MPNDLLLALRVDAKSVRDAIDVVEVCDDLSGIVDRSVIPPGFA